MRTAIPIFKRECVQPALCIKVVMPIIFVSCRNRKILMVWMVDRQVQSNDAVAACIVRQRVCRRVVVRCVEISVNPTQAIAYCFLIYTCSTLIDG